MMKIKNKIKNINKHINMRETKLDIIEMSRGYAGAILLMILMWTGVVAAFPSVEAMYAGECDEIDLSELDNTKDILYIVVGNSSDMEGFNVTLNATTNNAIICPAINYASDNFTLVFFNKQTNEVIKETIIYQGGSGGTSYVDKIVIQNQTVYVPEYVEREIEIERIIDNTIVLETGYELWHVLLAMALGGGFCWYVMRSFKKEDGDE